MQASNSMIIQVGEASPAGFHELDGVIGSVKVANRSSPQCNAICERKARNRFRAYAYAYPPNSSTWNTNMQVVHTPGLPPYQGRMYFPMMGWTWNSRNALTKMVDANNKTVMRWESVGFMDSLEKARRHSGEKLS